MACSFCTIRVLFILCTVFVALFIVSLVLAFKVFPDVLYSEINKAVRLDDGTEQYDRFLELPFPLDFKVYLFNVENPQEILNGAKPNVTEKGPYVYKQYRKKTILEINDEEDTISYTQNETFVFDPDASKGTLDDVITVLNPTLMSIYQLAEEFFMAGAADTCVKPTFPVDYRDIFIQAPVKDLLFDGFNFCVNDGNDLCSIVNDVICGIAATKRNTETLPDYSLQFSYVGYKSRTLDGKYTVNRGRDDISHLGHIMAWNDMKYTNYWKEGSTCSKVKGTDSTLYPPRVTKDSVFDIFSTDICRYVEINYQGEESYKDVNGLLFGTDPTTLQASTADPEDDCYCSKLSKNSDGEKSCFLDGVIDMNTCFGVPVLFSFPHFLWADQKYLDGVDGLTPNEEVHKTYLVVEPNTGTPLKGVKRIQLNAPLRPIVGIKSLLNMTRTTLPLLWIEEGVSLTDKYVDELNSKYFDKVKLVDGVKWSLIAVSALLSVVFGGIVIKKHFFTTKN